MNGPHLARVNQALASLAPGDRLLLALARIEGLSVTEIAEVLGRAPETVRRGLACAEARLALQLARPAALPAVAPSVATRAPRGV